MTATDQNYKFQLQREKLSKFSHKLLGELKAIIAEMSGDFFVLREKGLDKNILDIFNKLHNQLIILMKKIDPVHPYEGAERFVIWAEARTNKSTLENLNFIIQKHLDKLQENFQHSKILGNVRIESFIKLQHLLQEAKKYMAENPLIPDPMLHQPEPVLLNVREETKAPISQENETIVGIPTPKRQAI